jgi:hypothetical protein
LYLLLQQASDDHVVDCAAVARELDHATGCTPPGG